MDDFGDRIEELLQRVGTGELVGKVEVDQVYSHFQHESLDLNHPRGGQALFLQQPLMNRHGDYLQRIADRVLDTGPVDPMVGAVEDLSDQVIEHAPREFEDLRYSGHPTVEDAGRPVYDRAPARARLTEEELRAKSRARGGHPYGRRGRAGRH